MLTCRPKRIALVMLLALMCACAASPLSSTAATCKLDPQALQQRTSEFQTLLAGKATHIVERNDEIEVHFALSTLERARLADLIDAERQCCSSLDWRVNGELDGSTVLRVRGSKQDVRFVKEMIAPLLSTAR